MTATPYRPVTWNTEPISQGKLQQMADNDEWLFENAARVRYSVNGIVKDDGLKILVGKTLYGTSAVSAVYQDVYFGSFFSTNCNPIVTCTLETGTGLGRKQVTLAGFGGDVDSRGFRAAIYTDEVTYMDKAGWLHWQAIGY